MIHRAMAVAIFSEIVRITVTRTGRPRKSVTVHISIVTKHLHRGTAPP